MQALATTARTRRRDTRRTRRVRCSRRPRCSRRARASRRRRSCDAIRRRRRAAVARREPPRSRAPRDQRDLTPRSRRTTSPTAPTASPPRDRRAPTATASPAYSRRSTARSHPRASGELATIDRRARALLGGLQERLARRRMPTRYNREPVLAEARSRPCRGAASTTSRSRAPSAAPPRARTRCCTASTRRRPPASPVQRFIVARSSQRNDAKPMTHRRHRHDRAPAPLAASRSLSSYVSRNAREVIERERASRSRRR